MGLARDVPYAISDQARVSDVTRSTRPKLNPVKKKVGVSGVVVVARRWVARGTGDDE